MITTNMVENKMENILLCAQNISHYFSNNRQDRKKVLTNLNFEIRKNEIVSLVGKSGSGKSTFLKILSGLLSPSEGEIYFNSEVITKPSLKMAMVFQNFVLLPWLTVLENVSFGLEARRLPKKEIEEKAREIISLIGLSSCEDSYPKELSGGMRQRVGFARALAVEPELLLMDEPFSSLDIFTAHKLKEDLLKLWSDKKIKTTSMICVTHNIEEAVLFSNRVCLFDAFSGRINEEFHIQESYEQRNARSKYIISKVDEISNALFQVEHLNLTLNSVISLKNRIREYSAD